MLDAATESIKLPFKLLNNIFLLIVSIFKALSSNYVPLLAVALAFFYLFTFLSKRKLELPCSTCENGSWWYKCSPGTGFGTSTCREYTYITDISEDLYKLIVNGPDKYLQILLSLLQHSTNIIKKSVQFIDETTQVFSLLMPHWLLFKYLVKPIVKALFTGFDKVRNELSSFTCGFTIPVLDIEFDICKLIVEGIKALLKLIEFIFETLLDLIKAIVSFIFGFIKKYIFGDLIKIITTVIKFITNNIFKVFTLATKLINEITKPIHAIFDIPFHKYFVLVLDYIISLILDNIPGGSILKVAPSIIIGLAMLPLIFTILVPVIGATVALFALIKSLVFALLGVDDNDDFLFIFRFIFEFIFGIIKNLFYKSEE